MKAQKGARLMMPIEAGKVILPSHPRGPTESHGTKELAQKGLLPSSPAEPREKSRAVLLAGLRLRRFRRELAVGRGQNFVVRALTDCR